jgi:hypothetical protein
MRSRTAALAGIVFVVLYVAAWFVSKTPDSDASSAQIAAYYSDRGNRILMIVSAYLFVVAGLLFLHFVTGVRARLVADARHAADALGALVVTTGAVFVGLLMAGAMSLASVPASLSFGSSSSVVPESGDVVSIVQSVGYGMILVAGMLSAAVMILAASLLALRTRTLPRWTAWLGFVAAFVLLFAVVWVPQAALLIWTLAISIVLIRAPSPGRREAALQRPAAGE